MRKILYYLTFGLVQKSNPYDQKQIKFEQNSTLVWYEKSGQIYPTKIKTK